MRTSFTKATLFGLVLTALFFAFPGRASALSSDTCTVTHVLAAAVTTTGANRYLSIQCADGTFYLVMTQTQNTTTGCFTDIDTLKMWQSIATSAKLSGVPVTIFYNTTSGCPGFSGSQPVMSILDF